MPDTAPGQKTQLKLTRYSVNKDGTTTFDENVEFIAMLNPAEFKHSFGIAYDKKKKQGQAAANPKFAAVDTERVNFSLLLDGTGVVPGNAPNRPPKEVKQMVLDLNKVVYQYVGDKHEPGHVRVLWGSLIFFGRMETMSAQYTLFKPNGWPLRARIELSFVGAMSKKEEELVSNRSSPDLSHRIVVREGDTLPLLCHRVYGDPGYYVEIARFNRLVDFRRLVPGTKLHFPPLG